jgi:hypothetical protein
VRRYVRQAKARLGLHGQKAYVPGEPTPGCEAEVDWGDFKAYIAPCVRIVVAPKGITHRDRGESASPPG